VPVACRSSFDVARNVSAAGQKSSSRTCASVQGQAVGKAALVHCSAHGVRTRAQASANSSSARGARLGESARMSAISWRCSAMTCSHWMQRAGMFPHQSTRCRRSVRKRCQSRWRSCRAMLSTSSTRLSRSRASNQGHLVFGHGVARRVQTS